MIKEAVQSFYQSLLSLYTAREARHITHLIFEAVTGLSRLDMITKEHIILSDEQRQSIREKLDQLLQHKPVQYVLEKCWFYHLPFYVNEHVLIPRPETEELAEWIIREYAGKSKGSQEKSLTILEVGTGSGCLAVALKNNIPDAQFIAIDNSGLALEVAKRNAIANNAEIHFLQRDILQDGWAADLPTFDLIVSNPPYIPQKEKQQMQQQVVSFEPHQALFVPDNDPFLFYEALIQCAILKLNGEGKIFVEIHEELGASVMSLFSKYGFNDLQLHRDMNGRDRMIRAMKK